METFENKYVYKTNIIEMHVEPCQKSKMVLFMEKGNGILSVVWKNSIWSIWQSSEYTLFQYRVAFQIETSHLICAVNQRTGFYMKYKTRLKWVKNGSSKYCGRQPLQYLTWSIYEYFTPYDTLWILSAMNALPLQFRPNVHWYKIILI